MYRAAWAEHERADLQVERYLLLALLDGVEDFITHELKHSLHKVGATVGDLCDGRETGGDKLLVDNLIVKMWVQVFPVNGYIEIKRVLTDCATEEMFSAFSTRRKSDFGPGQYE